MATQTVFSKTNVRLSAAPPTFYEPSATGQAVPAGGLSWTVTVVSSKYAAGSSADLAIEYEYSGVWQQDAAVGGFTLGPYTFRGAQTSTNHFGSSIGSTDASGNLIGPYPTNARLRIDRIPAGTLDSVTLTLD